MQSSSDRQAYVLAATAGAALWLAAALASGRREAWDAPIYWSVGYPLALAVSAGLGYARPQRSWRWPLALFMAQFAAMVVRNAELGSLWPLGLVMFAVLSVPAIATARAGAWLRNRAQAG